jgi:peptide/nickel transport system substrate-binding protein
LRFRRDCAINNAIWPAPAGDPARFTHDRNTTRDRLGPVASLAGFRATRCCGRASRVSPFQAKRNKPMMVFRFASGRLAGRIGVAAAIALAALPLSAPCAEAAKTTLVLGMSVEPTGLDPTIAAPVAIGQVTWQNVYEGLVAIDRDGKIVPALAKSWTVTPDALTYTFTLQSGVKFHDGEPFDASVAKFALDRARAANSVNPQKQFFDSVETIEAPNPTTLVIKLKKPASNLLYWLGWPSSVMVAPKSAENNKTNPVGTGPFRFKSWSKGDRVELERNPDYWNKAKTVALTTATFRFLADPQAQAAALRAGDVDAFPEFGAPELYGAFQTDKRFAAVVGNTELKVVAGMNNARKPFSDKRVRQALMMAVDRKMLIEGAWSGYGQPIGSHYTPNDPGYIDLTGVYPHDPKKARELLAQAGYPEGFTFTIKTPQMAYATRTAEVLQGMFAEIGVTMSIAPTEFPAKWIQEVFKDTDFDMTIIAHAEPMDIAIYARDKYYFNYKNPEFNKVVAAAAEATDEKTRLADYGKAQRILAEDVPALYLFVMPKLGVWNAKLKGLWKNEPIPSNVLTDVAWED